MAQDMVEAGRLAFRLEGELWNAYWVPSLMSMQGAVLLCSVRVSLVHEHESLKKGFKDFAKLLFTQLAKDTFGTVTVYDNERPGPENERGGCA